MLISILLPALLITLSPRELRAQLAVAGASTAAIEAAVGTEEAAPPTTTTTTTATPKPALPPAKAPPAIEPPPPSVERAARKKRVLVLDLVARGVPLEVTRTLSDLAAAAVVSEPGYVVSSSGDLNAVVETAGVKQTLGCDAKLDTCMAELAGALDADLVVSGSVGSLGALTVVSISLYDARSQASIGREQAQAERLSEVGIEVKRAVGRLFGHADPVSSSSSIVPAVVAVVGVASIVGGALGAVYGASVQTDPKSPGSAKEAGVVVLPAGIALAAGGAVAVVVGATFLVLE